MLKRSWLVIPVSIAVVWWLSAMRIPPGGTSRPVPSDQPTSLPAPAIVADIASEEHRDVAPVVAGERAEALPDPATVVESVGGRRLRGTVRVADIQGVDHPHESGSMVLTMVTDEGDETVVVDIRDGSFLVELTPGVAELDITELRLGGRLAYRDVEDFIVLADEQRSLDLAARWARDTVLRVRDRATGAELTGVTLLRDDAGEASYLLSTSYDDRQVLLRDAVSPIRLLPEVRQPIWTCFVAAPGYALARLDLAGGAAGGGERVVLLERGGGADIALVGPGRGAAARLHLRQMDAEVRPPDIDVPIDDREGFSFDGLLPGEYRVTAEMGRWFEERLVIGAVRITVLAGERVHAELPLAAVPQAASVPLAGLVLVPVEWRQERFSLILSPLGALAAEAQLVIDAEQMEMLGGNPALFRFDAGMVDTGRYRAEVRPFQYSDVLLVGDAGAADVRIQVPPPGEVVVRLVDASSGAPVAVPRMNWSYQGPAEPQSSEFTSVDANDDGIFRFLAPQGPVELRIWEEGLQFVSEKIEVRPGLNDIRLTMTVACGVEFELYDGADRLPWPQGLHVELEEPGGDGAATSWTWLDFGMRIVVSHAGGYRLTLGEVPGYQPIPPQELQIRPGMMLRHDVLLTRVP